jgi:hypothetical protein
MASFCLGRSKSEKDDKKEQVFLNFNLARDTLRRDGSKEDIEKNGKGHDAKG